MAGVKGRSGRRPLGAKTGLGRAAMRNIVDDPERWARYVAAIDKQLDQGNAGPFQIAFEHGYGRPPQALDVRTATVQPGEQVIYAAAFADGDPLGEAPEAAAAEAVPEGSGQ